MLRSMSVCSGAQAQEIVGKQVGLCAEGLAITKFVHAQPFTPSRCEWCTPVHLWLGGACVVVRVCIQRARKHIEKSALFRAMLCRQLHGGILCVAGCVNIEQLICSQVMHVSVCVSCAACVGLLAEKGREKCGTCDPPSLLGRETNGHVLLQLLGDSAVAAQAFVVVMHDVGAAMPQSENSLLLQVGFFRCR